MAKVVMNPVMRSSGIDFCKGVIGTNISSNGLTFSAPVNLPNTPKICYPSVSCSETRARRQRRAAVAVRKETKVGQPGDEVQNGYSNGAANGVKTGTSQIRDAILEKPKSSSVYDYSDSPGPRSVQNYMEQAPNFLVDDGGPPRWFSPVVSAPPADAPSLFFLPGMDGTGLGLILHYESLGRLFNMQCLHIPVRDRTPFTGLLKIAEEAVLAEHARRPNTPKYLIGDSFGASLSLAVAARNPTIDLVLVLVNPGLSCSPCFLCCKHYLPSCLELFPTFLSFIVGDPIRMAEAKVEASASPAERALKLRESLLSLLLTLPALADVIPKGTLLWKLKLLHSAALYTNSRLHAVRAQVLILASGKDQMLPSADESKRLRKSLSNCRVRHFKDSGHTLLLEGGLNLASVLQGAGVYRRGQNQDVITDFVVPTQDEFDAAYNGNLKLIWQTISPVFFSTTDSGEVEQGLQNVPNDRPVLFVGNHMYFGVDMYFIIYKMFKERGLMVRGLAHPMLLETKWEEDLQESTTSDLFRNFGAVPVSGRTMFKLLRAGYSTLLYPGGAREALHRKGEAHKIFWPERSEFVRMAARFGCTIVPVSTVGEDELFSIILDLNDIRRIPTLEEKVSFPAINIRRELHEEVADQSIHFPFAAPKLPQAEFTSSSANRLLPQMTLDLRRSLSAHTNFLSKDKRTRREKELQKDKQQAQAIYKHVQGEVERGLEYLLWKRQEDPYREFGPRFLYERNAAHDKQAPTFKP